MLRFFCWRCEGELMTVTNEQCAIDSWVQCPNEFCQAMNSLIYRFPEAKVEVV